MWLYLPPSIGLVPAFSWEMIYFSMSRMQPFRDLAKPQGSLLKDSLSQNYSTSISWFVPFRAARHPNGHHGLALASISFLLSYATLPAATAGSIKITFDEVESAYHVEPVLWLVIVVLAASTITSLCGISAFLILSNQKTGLHTDPGGIEGIGCLVADGSLISKFRVCPSFATQADIDASIGLYRIYLDNSQRYNSTTITLIDDHQHVSPPVLEPFQRSFTESHSWWLRIRVMLGITVALLVPNAIIVFPSSRSLSTIPWTKVLMCILSSISAACATNWQFNVALLEPYYRLCRSRRGIITGSNDALNLEYSVSAAYSLLQASFGPTRSISVWIMSLEAVLAQVCILFTPVLPQMIGHGAISDLLFPGLIAPQSLSLFIPFWFMVGVYLFALLLVLASTIIVFLHKHKLFLPRKPYTLSSTLSYICHSKELLDNLKGMAQLSKAERAQQMQLSHGKFGLGWVTSDNQLHSRIAIDSTSKITNRFTYPKPGTGLPDRSA